MKRVEKSEKSVGVKKPCPQCDQMCPVALRECKCGFNFTKTKSLKTKGGKVKKKGQKPSQNAAAKGMKASTSAASTSDDGSLDKVGRRFRTKRMRPDFFNSLELEYASKTFRTRKPKQSEKELKRKKKRGRPKGSTGIPRKTKEKKEEEVKPLPELDDLYANFSQDRLQQFSFILDELNSKMSLTMFKPL